MSEKDAQTLAVIVAANVRRWREARGLDQQGLADRLNDLGWPVDRTTVNRMENYKARQARRVTVDDLGYLAVALNVPLPLLLIPAHAGVDVKLTADTTLNRWWFWEWMRGSEALPGRITKFGDEWHSGAAPLRVYDEVVWAQEALSAHLMRHNRSLDDPPYRSLLQRLLDAVEHLAQIGVPGQDLIADKYAADIARLRLVPKWPQSAVRERMAKELESVAGAAAIELVLKLDARRTAGETAEQPQSRDESRHHALDPE